MPASAKLLSIATANAPNVMTQTDVVRVAQALFRDRFPGIDRMLPVFDTAGIRTRQSAMPLDWYLTPRSWPERTQAYLDIALEQASVTGVTTWGLSDRHSWLQKQPVRPTASPAGLNRGLPYDGALTPKPVYWTIQQAMLDAKASPMLTNR